MKRMKTMQNRKKKNHLVGSFFFDDFRRLFFQAPSLDSSSSNSTSSSSSLSLSSDLITDKRPMIQSIVALRRLTDRYLERIRRRFYSLVHRNLRLFHNQLVFSLVCPCYHRIRLKQSDAIIETSIALLFRT